MTSENVPATAVEEFWQSIQPGYKYTLPEATPVGEGTLGLLRAAAKRFVFAYHHVCSTNPRSENLADAFELWMLTFGPPKEILRLMGIHVSGGWYWNIWSWNKRSSDMDAEACLQRKYRELKLKYKLVFRKDVSQPHVNHGHWDSYVVLRESGEVVAYLPWHYDVDMRMFRLEVESPV